MRAILNPVIAPVLTMMTRGELALARRAPDTCGGGAVTREMLAAGTTTRALVVGVIGSVARPRS